MKVPKFAAHRPLVVVTTQTRWDETPRIRHQVTRQLALFCNVVFVELPFAADRVTDEFVAVNPALLVFKPRSPGAALRRLRNHLKPARWLHDAALVRRVTRLVRELGYDRASLVNFQFDFAAVMRAPQFVRKVYLCNDEFQGDSRFWVRALNLAAENEVVRRADVALAVSVPLMEKLRAIAPGAQLFLPGHEAQIEAHIAVRERAEPALVCCMGFLNSRLRIDWLEELASDARFQLDLIGPLENPQDWARLLARPNVSHADALVGAALHARMRLADVFVMPYDSRQHAVRAITAPNKLFQYLACGRPVVCSDLPHLVELPQSFLYVAANSAAFVDAVWRAFAEDSPAATTDRLAYAARNSWSARGDVLRQLLAMPAVR